MNFEALINADHRITITDTDANLMLNLFELLIKRMYVDMRRQQWVRWLELYGYAECAIEEKEIGLAHRHR